MAARASILLGALALLASGATTERGAATPDRAGECGRCHRAELESWSRSPHAHSGTEPQFAASFARSRLRWCLDCHAPRSAPHAARPTGIDCVTCHVSDGAVLTSHAPTPAGKQAHRLVQSAALGTVQACAPCHQFDAPEQMREPLRFTATPMQDTVHEWSHSWAGAHALSCQSCHMAGGTHDIEGGHDLALLQHTVSVDLERADGGWTAALVARGAGHAVPTGDPFRRFVLEVRARNGEVIALRSFGRTLWDRTDAGWSIRDTAAPPPLDGSSRSPALSFSAPADGFDWTLRYRTDEPGLSAVLPADDYELEVSRGSVR